MGLFIDEVGKFMTANNDHFFPAAAPIIYGFFLLTVLVYIRVAKKGDQKEEVNESYTSLESVPEQEVHARVEGFVYKLATQSRLKVVLLAGLFLFGIGACIRLVYYYSGGTVLLETLLYSRISNLPNTSSNAIFLATVQLWLEGLVGVLLVTSSIFLVLGRERTGITLGSYGLIISLVGVNLVSFYIDQFGTIAKALSQFVLLYVLYYYQRRFFQTSIDE